MVAAATHTTRSSGTNHPLPSPTELQHPQPKQTRRQRKERQEQLVVADLVQTALVAKQRETEQEAAAARTQRRKRAPRKHKRVASKDQSAADAAVDGEHPPSVHTRNGNRSSNLESRASIVMLDNLVLPDELEDSDEYEEIVADLERDFVAFGRLVSLNVERTTGAVRVVFVELASAQATVNARHGKRFGGREVTARLATSRTGSNMSAVEDGSASSCRVFTEPAAAASPRSFEHAAGTETKPQTRTHHAATTTKKKRRSKCKSAVLRARLVAAAAVDSADTTDTTGGTLTSPNRFLVRNLLTPNDVDDPDEREELVVEARSDFAAFGALLDLVVHAPDGRDDEELAATSSDDWIPRAGDVEVEFCAPASASAAFAAYNNRVFDNRTVACQWRPRPSAAASQSVMSARIVNMFHPAELEDDDEFEDTRDEVAELLARFGVVRALDICRESGDIVVCFATLEAVEQAVAKMHNSVYGGRSIVAHALGSADKDTVQAPSAAVPAVVESSPKPTRAFEVPPMASEFIGVITQLLTRLAQLQERAHHVDPLHDKRSRRLVLGLNEVRRGLVTSKIRLLLVATDVEDCAALDEKLTEILVTAKQADVPLAFPMTRRKLGRALGKNVRVSCVGVCSFDGANDLFAEVIRGCASASSSISRGSSRR